MDVQRAVTILPKELRQDLVAFYDLLRNGTAAWSAPTTVTAKNQQMAKLKYDLLKSSFDVSTRDSSDRTAGAAEPWFKVTAKESAPPVPLW